MELHPRHPQTMSSSPVLTPTSKQQSFLSLDHQSLTNLPDEYTTPEALSPYEIVWLNHNSLTPAAFALILDILSGYDNIKWFSCIQGGDFWPGFDENPTKYDLYRLYVLHFWHHKDKTTLSTLDSKRISKDEWKHVQNHSKEDFTTETCTSCNEVIWVNSLHWKVCPTRKRSCPMHRFGCTVRGTQGEVQKHQDEECPYYKVRHVLQRMDAKIAHLEQELIDVTMKHHPIRLVTPKCLVLIPSTKVQHLEMISASQQGETLEESVNIGERQSSIHTTGGPVPSSSSKSSSLIYKVLQCRDHENDVGDEGSDNEIHEPHSTDSSQSSSTSTAPSDISAAVCALKDLVTYTPILTKYQIQRLHPKFPVRFQNCDFVLLHTTSIHGTSLLHAIQRCRTCEPILLVIRSMKGEVFGAYCSNEWRDEWKQYYGSGESFLWTFEPDLKVYKWTKANSYFQYSNKKFIAMGGGSSFGKGYGLRLNADMMSGVTLPSETFGNEVLVPSQRFEVSNVEFWSFKTRK